MTFETITQPRGVHYIKRALGLMTVLVLSGCGTNPPPTFDGTWMGTGGDGMHVASIFIEKDEFPCKGSVATQYGSGQGINLSLTWKKEGDQLVGSMGEGKVVVTAKLTGNTLSGKVIPPIVLGGSSELTFSGFTKQIKK